MSPLKCRIVRLVTCAWLAGWYIKIAFYGPYLLDVTQKIQVKSDFFPSIFLNPITAVALYFIPLVSLTTFFSQKRSSAVLSSLLMVFSSWGLLLHINTYNDATFITSFWAGLWLLWFSYHREDECFWRHAAALAQLIIALIFLGGFVGKLTSAYLSGEVFYQIFMVQSKGTFISYAAGLFSETAQRLLAGILAKIVLIFEGLLGISFILPVNLSAISALIILPLLALFSTWRIFSVTASLIGLALACLLMVKEACHKEQKTRIS